MQLSSFDKLPTGSPLQSCALSAYTSLHGVAIGYRDARPTCCHASIENRSGYVEAMVLKASDPASSH